VYRPYLHQAKARFPCDGPPTQQVQQANQAHVVLVYDVAL